LVQFQAAVPKMKKNKKLVPELALGFTDRKGDELILKDKLIDIIKKNFQLFGFEPLETPGFEISENIGKFLPDEDRPMSGVFGFKEKSQWMSLRYDLTAPLARYVAQNYRDIPRPFKRYQVGSVWRNEKPGPGRFREFTQIDADIVGTRSTYADAEMCMLMANTLLKCGLEKNEFIIKINNRKIFQGILDFFDIQDPKQSLTILRSIDKFQNIGKKGVLELLTKGRLDSSGDFTKGANLKMNIAEEIFELFSAGSITRFDGKYRLTGSSTLYQIDNKIYLEGIKELEEIFNYLKATGEINIANTDTTYVSDKINIQLDYSVVRGLEYYTGPIFEAETAETAFWKEAPEDPKAFKKIKIGSIGGGGRYDKLVSRFLKDDFPATGMSIGLDRVLMFLKEKNKNNKPLNYNPIIICVFDKENFSKYYELVKILRSANVNSEIYSGDGDLKSQMKYANKRNAPGVIFYGDDEIKLKKINFKNLETGVENSIEINNLANEIKKFI